MLFQGGVILRTFVPDSGFGCWHICHVDRHCHFTLKQLRLSLVSETHTKPYPGPRLNAIIKMFDKLHFANTLTDAPNERTEQPGSFLRKLFISYILIEVPWGVQHLICKNNSSLK